MENSSSMFFVLPRIAPSLFFALMLLLFSGSRLVAALNGPTLHLDFGLGEPMTNPLGKFMYFVPLISPEQVSVLTNAGNTQCARVTSFQCRTNGNTFHTLCEFDFVGEGMQ